MTYEDFFRRYPYAEGVVFVQKVTLTYNESNMEIVDFIDKPSSGSDRTAIIVMIRNFFFEIFQPGHDEKGVLDVFGEGDEWQCHDKDNMTKALQVLPEESIIEECHYTFRSVDSAMDKAYLRACELAEGKCL